MSELQFAAVFVDVENNHFDFVTHFRVLVRVIETLQPAQVADMDHTTDTGRQFHENAVRGDVFTTPLWRLPSGNLTSMVLHGSSVICLMGEAHLAVIFIQGYHFGFMLIAQFEEFFGVDRGIGP